MAKAAKKLPSTAVGRRRLLKLVDLLRKNARNKKGAKFDLNIFGSTDYYVTGEKAMTCNTAGCALGLGAISGVFEREGFVAEMRREPFGSYHISPTYKGYTGFAAGDEFFSLERDETLFLFDPDLYEGRQIGAKGERKVAQRIKDFVSGKFVDKPLARQ